MTFLSKSKIFHGIISGSHLLKDSGIHPPWSFVNPLFFNSRFLKNPANQLNEHLDETLAI